MYYLFGCVGVLHLHCVMQNLLRQRMDSRCGARASHGDRKLLLLWNMGARASGHQ